MNTKQKLDNLLQYEDALDLPPNDQDNVFEILSTISIKGGEIQKRRLKKELCEGEGCLSNTYFYAYLQWLEIGQYINYYNKQDNAKGRPFRYVRITPNGKEKFSLYKNSSEILNNIRRAMMIKDVSERLDVLRIVIESTFEIAYNSLHEYGQQERYKKFLESIETPIREELTKSKIEKLKESISDNNLPIKLFTLDPYLRLIDLELIGLYYDAKLAVEMNHLLTENHSYILQETGELKKHQIILHNKRRLKELLEKKVVNTNFHSEYLQQHNTILKELNEREEKLRTRFGEQVATYYHQVRNSPSFSRNRQILLN